MYMRGTFVLRSINTVYTHMIQSHSWTAAVHTNNLSPRQICSMPLKVLTHPISSCISIASLMLIQNSQQTHLEKFKGITPFSLAHAAAACTAITLGCSLSACTLMTSADAATAELLGFPAPAACSLLPLSVLHACHECC